MKRIIFATGRISLTPLLLNPNANSPKNPDQTGKSQLARRGSEGAYCGSARVFPGYLPGGCSNAASKRGIARSFARGEAAMPSGYRDERGPKTPFHIKVPGTS